MITASSGKNELLTEIDETVSQMNGLMTDLDEQKVNTVPFKDSWTPGQLFRHVIKSTGGLAKAMSMDATPAIRNAGERIPELKKTFLDFSIKMNSPEFIVPEEGPYEKQASIKSLDSTFEQLKESVNNADLTEIVEGLPFGPISKLEMLHFVVYHTQRHLHQMKKISDALKN